MLKIIGRDITGNWSIDKYSLQKGHMAKFLPNMEEHNIKKIHWKLGDSKESNKYCVTHIFTKTNQNIELPAEGYVTIKCKITNNNGEVFKAKKTILIVPQVKGMIQYEGYDQINENTCEVTLLAQPLFEALVLGNPFKGNPSYACGGACVDTCPQYEIIIKPMQGTIVTKYGVQILTVQPMIRSDPHSNDTCISLYKNNHLGKKAKYPQIIAKVNVIPKESEIKIIVNENEKLKREIFICGLADCLISNDMRIKWRILNKQTNEYFIVTTKQNNLKHKFVNFGKYIIEATILILNCPSVSTKAKITLFCHQSDIIEYYATIDHY